MSADLDASGMRGGSDPPVSSTDTASQDARVLAAVLKWLLRGETVSPASLGPGTGLTQAEVEAALTRLDAAGALYMAGGAVRAAYPLYALAGEGRRVDHRVIPRTIFTDPQVAVVGMTDAEAHAAGHRCRCTAIPMSAVPRAGAVRDPRGVIKMVIDRDTEEVLGVSMLGLNAGEVIHEAAMALRFRAIVHDFIDLVLVYPTMAEALKIVALSFFKDVSKLSCCAE